MPFVSSYIYKSSHTSDIRQIYNYIRQIANNVLAMKLAVFCLLAVISIVYAEEYTSKFDNIDVDAVIKNDRLLKRYVDCLLDKPDVRCPPEAIELKKHISEALANECEKCTERQKEMVRKVMKHLVKNKRDWWNLLKTKYDPEEKYAKKYEDLANKEDVQI